MGYIGNQDFVTIETNVGNIAGTDTESNIKNKSNVNGQMWVASDTGDLWLSDDTQWMNVGKIKGDKGVVGDRGIGITSITKTSTDNTVDTYTITYDDTSTDMFTVTNANTWITGVTAPSNTEGLDGDLYLDTQLQIVYKKSAGIWNTQGSIKGESFSYDAMGTLAERSTHDDAAAGFGYLSYAETPPKVYFKLSATSGDWSDGTAVGKGEVGIGIQSIVKTATNVLTDTYTITYINGDTLTYNIKNGRGIDSIRFTSTTDGSGLASKSGATDTYTISYNDGSNNTFVVYNGLDGEVLTSELNTQVSNAKKYATAMAIAIG